MPLLDEPLPGDIGGTYLLLLLLLLLLFVMFLLLLFDDIEGDGNTEGERLDGLDLVWGDGGANITLGAGPIQWMAIPCCIVLLDNIDRKSVV